MVRDENIFEWTVCHLSVLIHLNKLIEIKAYPLSKEEPYGSLGGFDIRRLA